MAPLAAERRGFYLKPSSAARGPGPPHRPSDKPWLNETAGGDARVPMGLLSCLPGEGRGGSICTAASQSPLSGRPEHGIGLRERGDGPCGTMSWLRVYSIAGWRGKAPVTGAEASGSQDSHWTRVLRWYSLACEELINGELGPPLAV